MQEVLFKGAQFSFQKIIIWTNKSGKNKHEWAKACKHAYFCP
jgi:hypothetical protein